LNLRELTRTLLLRQLLLERKRLDGLAKAQVDLAFAR
jgi:hypothetical protein